MLPVDIALLFRHYLMSPREGADHNENSDQLVSSTRSMHYACWDGRVEGGGATVLIQIVRCRSNVA